MDYNKEKTTSNNQPNNRKNYMQKKLNFMNKLTSMKKILKH